MVTRCCGFYEGLFLEVSSLSAIMQNNKMRAIQLIGYEINLLNKV